jgi:transcriptional regulator with XRE-family HTH domain
LTDIVEHSQLLADAIEHRRVELGLSPSEFAEATGVTMEGLRRLRRGEVRRYQQRLTGPVCRILGWTPDSIDRLLSGQPPETVSGGVSEPVLRLAAENAELQRSIDAGRFERAQLRVQLDETVRAVATLTEQVRLTNESVAELNGAVHELRSAVVTLERRGRPAVTKRASAR